MRLSAKEAGGVEPRYCPRCKAHTADRSCKNPRRRGPWGIPGAGSGRCRRMTVRVGSLRYWRLTR